MNKFKKGDRVRCIIADNPAGKFILGQVYTVSGLYGGDYPYIKEMDIGDGLHWFRSERFELATEAEDTQSPDTLVGKKPKIIYKIPRLVIEE